MKTITLLINVLLISAMMPTMIAASSIDLSNVDFAKFKYFKYPSPKSAVPPSNHFFMEYRHQPQPPPMSASPLSKAMAMVKYAARVLFGNLPNTPDVPIVFDPEFGKKWQPHFQRQFGRRGEKLIELLGKGYSKSELVHYGAVSRDT